MIQIIYRNNEVTDREPVTLPLSKSIALRVMTLNGVCRAQGVAPARIPLLPDAEDVEGMERAMRYFDSVIENPADRFPETVHIGEGGAPLRFFTALASSTSGVDLSLFCSPGLMRRPLAILLDALKECSASVRSLDRPGYPPLKIIGRHLTCSDLRMNPGVSSQFVSALMMASPLWTDGLRLTFDGHTPVSTPYIRMTASIMERFGLKVRIEAEGETGNLRIVVPRQTCHAPAEYPIETDWSAASYFYEIALLLPGVEIPIDSLTPAADSLQGDARCQQIFSLLGVDTRHPAAETSHNSHNSQNPEPRTQNPEPGTRNPEPGTQNPTTLYCDPEKLRVFQESSTPLELDMNDTPDLVPALTVGFCLAGVKFRFTSVAHLRHKETDRLAALTAEMEKIGYMLEMGDETLSWTGRRCPASDNEAIATYSDHRMAMAFAPAAIKLPYLVIEHPEVVGKSFPGYWQQLRRLGFHIAPPSRPTPL